MSQARTPPSRLRIGVITGDLAGMKGSEPHAAIMRARIRTLASRGDSVTVFRLPEPGDESEGSLESFEQQREVLADSGDIHLVKLPPDMEIVPGDMTDEQLSLRIFHAVRAEEMDCLYFDLKGGLAYFTLLAREMGIFPADTQCFLFAEEPLAWQAATNRRFLENLSEVAVDFRERYCVTHADGLLFSGHGLPLWMKETGWALPARSAVLPIPLPMERMTPPDSGNAASPSPLQELTYIGGATFREGLTLFCDALDQCVADGQPPACVSFLGEFGRVLGEHSGGMILRRARKWPFELKLLPNLSLRECIRYVLENSCLTVFPALAANAPVEIAMMLQHRLPFIATRVGGIPEMIAPEFHDRALCDPDPRLLASGIRAWFENPVQPVRPALSPDEIEAAWRDHLNGVAARVSQPPTSDPASIPAASPLVSIVLVHHDRPELLGQALDSVRAQTYPHVELILVDDGSSLPGVAPVLDALEPEFSERGWHLLREPNRYLGAARNVGIRASRGEFVIFLDDDNVLFPEAVASFVDAIQYSGSDICTCFSKLLFDDLPPGPDHVGHIHYFPLGGSLDLSLFHNTIGDANAIIRRSVFDQIGFLIEDYGYTCHDWEFFVRALLHDLKVRLIPQALYWYRQDGRGMYRQSHWYENRQPILKLFREHRFEGLDHLVDLALSSHVGDFDRESFQHNRLFDPADRMILNLRVYEPGSDAALEHLAAIADAEGRPETGIGLRSRVHLSPEELQARDLAKTRPILNDEDVELAANETGLKRALSLRGHLERVECISEGGVRIVGWVAHMNPGNPLPHVALFLNGSLLGVTAPDTIRPDLAAGFDAPHLNQTCAQFTFVGPAELTGSDTLVGIALNRRGRFHTLTQN